MDSLEVKVIAGVVVGLFGLIIVYGALKIHNKLLHAKMEKTARKEIQMNNPHRYYYLLLFDGDSEKLSSFKDSVIFLKSVTQEANLPTLKLFILTRISGKARDALLTDIGNKSIDEIIDLITQSCDSKTTSDQVLPKLKAIKRGTARQRYCEEIESRCSQLSRTYVKEGIPQVTAKKIATKAGVDTLIKTVSTENAKIVLQAGSFPTIEQAIQKLNELPDNTESNDVNHIFNINANQKRYQNFNQRQRGNWKRGVNSNNNNFARRCGICITDVIDSRSTKADRNCCVLLSQNSTCPIFLHCTTPGQNCSTLVSHRPCHNGRCTA
ncbi:uncharacterized protein LOC134218149 [Armigeres subalbatus]|uniref:uncharacterized protein LOC134218149 n=1 Tax=Armigeres subalbatus TaxID=124917 RepID=UPI002ED3FB6A